MRRAVPDADVIKAGILDPGVALTIYANVVAAAIDQAASSVVCNKRTSTTIRNANRAARNGFTDNISAAVQADAAQAVRNAGRRATSERPRKLHSLDAHAAAA